MHPFFSLQVWESLCRRIAGEYLWRNQNTDYISHAYWGTISSTKFMPRRHEPSFPKWYSSRISKAHRYEKSYQNTYKHINECWNVEYCTHDCAEKPQESPRLSVFHPEHPDKTRSKASAPQIFKKAGADCALVTLVTGYSHSASTCTMERLLWADGFQADKVKQLRCACKVT